MNLGLLIQGAANLIPQGIRGPIVFRDKDGNETTAEAVGVPAHGTQSDGFKEGTVIREKNRRLSVFPERLSFAPKTGMTADWEGGTWNVLGVSSLDPSGSGSPSLYGVTLSR